MCNTIATGNNFTVFITNDGSLWGCGLNNHGQLGTKNKKRKNTPARVPDLVILLRKSKSEAELEQFAFLQNRCPLKKKTEVGDIFNPTLAGFYKKR